MPHHKESSLLLLLRRCTSFHQLQSIHGQYIAAGILANQHSHSSTILTIKLLYTFTALSFLPPASVHYPVSLFQRLVNPSTFPYNLVIRSYLLTDAPQSALHLFSGMRRSAVPPDFHTFPFAVKAATLLRSATTGRALHAQCLAFGYIDDVFVRNGLMSLYVDLGSVIDARAVFDDATWLDVVSYNALIDGYVKSGNIDFARRLFDEMPSRDAVSCGTLLAGYSKAERHKEVFELFGWMVRGGIRPDDVALVSTLSSCSQLGDLNTGRNVHEYIKRNGIKPNVYVLTGLVDMYAKCGCIDVAVDIFESARNRNLFTWNAIIVALGVHGEGELSLKYFNKMQEAGVQADGITFLGVLLACSHIGSIDMARKLFNEIETTYGVKRELKHYGCMVDLLSRAGFIREAIEMVRTMPMVGDVFVWGGLLGGCRIHSNVKVAEIAVRHLLELNPGDSGIYSVMANIYASAKRWEDAARIRKFMDHSFVRKNAACSSLYKDIYNLASL